MDILVGEYPAGHPVVFDRVLTIKLERKQADGIAKPGVVGLRFCGQPFSRKGHAGIGMVGVFRTDVRMGDDQLPQVGAALKNPRQVVNVRGPESGTGEPV